MRFGRQVVTFVSVTEDPSQRDEDNNPLIVRTETPVSGCRFRPLTADEKVNAGIDLAKDPWRATCPPVAPVVGATAGDEVKVDGVTYQITGGVRVFPGVNGQPFKVTVLAERQTV